MFYINNGNINTNNLAISIGDNDFFNDANIELAGSFEIIAKNFTNETTVDVANNFNVTASGDFDNNAMISANALGISADSFLNEGGNIIVDTLNLSLARYFDYSSTTKKLEFSLPELMKSALTSAKNKSAESISPKLSKLLTNKPVLRTRITESFAF